MSIPNRRLAAARQDAPAAAASTDLVTFDIDAFHVMEARDERLIAERINGGSVGSIFVYDFQIQGKQVAGISVEGAQHLAYHYKGIKHRIVATQQKIGSVFTFTTYPAENMPMQVHVSVLPELAAEDDFYRAVVEITDIKTGNTWQAEKSESKFENRANGTKFERPNYATIAQSKARRNAILMAVPFDVQEEFKRLCLAQGKNSTLTQDVFAEKRDQILKFATQKGVQVDRPMLMQLASVQVDGLRKAIEDGGVEAFTRALHAITGVQAETDAGEPEPAAARKEEAPRRQQRAAPQQQAARAPQEPAQAQQQQEPPHDPETGEVDEGEPQQQEQQTSGPRRRTARPPLD